MMSLGGTQYGNASVPSGCMMLCKVGRYERLVSLKLDAIASIGLSDGGKYGVFAV